MALKKTGDISKKGAPLEARSFRMQSTFMKQAAASDTVDVTQSSPSWYHPALTPPNWLLPRSLIEVQNWANIFYNNEPLVHNIIDLYATYSLSKFDLVVEDAKIKREYEECISNEEFDLYPFLKQVSLQYWKLGEAIIYGTWDPKLKRWKKLILLENSAVDVKMNRMDGKIQYFLKPTQALRDLIKSTNEDDQAYVKTLDPEMVVKIANNEAIELEADNIMIFANITRPGDTRGTPFVQPLFKTLMYQDRLKVAQMAIADRHITPIQLWKVGSVAAQYIPTQEDLDNLRDMLETAALDPSFAVIYHDAVQFEAVGIKDKIIPLQPEFEYVDNKILENFGVTKAIITGEGPAFANPQMVALQVFASRNLAYRDDLEQQVMINFFFRRIAKERGYKNMRVTPVRLMLPEIAWYKDPLFEDNKEKEMFFKMWDKGVLSTKTLFSKFKTLDYEKEKRNLEEEKNTVFDSHNRLPKAVVNKAEPAAGGESPAGETIEEAPEATPAPTAAPTPEAGTTPEAEPTPVAAV